MPIQKQIIRYQVKRSISTKVGWISLRIHQYMVVLTFGGYASLSALPFVPTFRFTSLQITDPSLTISSSAAFPDGH